jgi:hypothetical protein
MSLKHHTCVGCKIGFSGFEFCPGCGIPPEAKPDFAAISKERKETPVWSGFLRYFPYAVEVVARHSRLANEKHNPGQPLHWARGKSKDHLECATRHLMTPEEIDPEFGDTHLAAAAWRVLAALQEQEERRRGERPSWHTDD